MGALFFFLCGDVYPGSVISLGEDDLLPKDPFHPEEKLLSSSQPASSTDYSR